MPRPRRDKPEYRLFKRPERRNWYVAWSEPGSRRTSIASTGVPISESADQWLADFIHMREAPPPGARVDVLVDAYLDARTEARTHDKMTWFAKPLKAHFGKLTPEQITPAVVNAYQKKRSPRLASCRRELELLMQTLNMHGFNVQIARPAPRPPREHFATKEQAERLLAASNGHLRLYLLIAMATGARKGAVLDLTWDRVDFDHRIIDFNNPDIPISNKRRVPVPIPAGVVAALRDAKERTTAATVIEYGGKPVADIKKSFKAAVVRAKLPKWLTPHILKHSVISWLAEDGEPLDQIAKFTGTSIKTVDRVYRKTNPEALRDMAKGLDFGALGAMPSDHKVR